MGCWQGQGTQSSLHHASGPSRRVQRGQWHRESYAEYPWRRNGLCGSFEPFEVGSWRAIRTFHHLDRERLQEAQRDLRHVQERCAFEAGLHHSPRTDGERGHCSHHQQQRSAVCSPREVGSPQGLRAQEKSLEEQGGDEEVEPLGQEDVVEGWSEQEEESQGYRLEGPQQEAQEGR